MGPKHIQILDDGTVWTCGLNDAGQLGREISPKKHSLVPGLVDLPTIVKIFGGERMWALSESGEVFAWGDNQNGQLGSLNFYLFTEN